MIVSKFGMKKRKPSESFQFLSFGIFGRYETRFYLRMSAQMLVYVTQKASPFINNLMVLGKVKKQKMVYKPEFSPISAVVLFDVSSKEGICGCGMVLKLNDRHCFNL